MISHQHQCIFIHLRRTAGNSIELALGGLELLDADGQPTQVWDNQLHRGKTPFKIDRRGHYIHSTAREVAEAFPVEFASYFRFSIVRNPWDQMVSHYLRSHSDDPDAVHFKEWLSRFDKPEGTVPRSSLYDEDGRCLVDFIGRFESLQQDFDGICDRLGTPRKPLPRTNAVAKRDYRSYFDDESVRFVEEIFGEDIDRFGYQFD